MPLRAHVRFVVDREIEGLIGPELFPWPSPPVVVRSRLMWPARLGGATTYDPWLLFSNLTIDPRETRNINDELN